MAVAKNDVTGDKIQSKFSKAYADNYDNIFTKPQYTDGERYQFIRSVMLDLGKQKKCEGLWFAEPETCAEFDKVVDALITKLKESV